MSITTRFDHDDLNERLYDNDPGISNDSVKWYGSVWKEWEEFLDMGYDTKDPFLVKLPRESVPVLVGFFACYRWKQRYIEELRPIAHANAIGFIFWLYGKPDPTVTTVEEGKYPVAFKAELELKWPGDDSKT